MVVGRDPARTDISTDDDRRARFTVVAGTLVALAGICWLALALPSNAFFTGDAGLKYIAAAHAAAHPGSPFEVNLPTIDGRPVQYVDPMIAVHGTHAHVLQSPVFPVMTAPFVAAFGIRGAYVLPALSFVVMVPLLALIRRYAAPHVSLPLLVVIAVAANPMLFYSLELWEHGPAIALLTAATAVLLRPPAAPRGRWDAMGGAITGLAILLRPEAVWYLAGTMLAVDRRRWLVVAAGVGVVVLPFSLASYAHSGSLVGPHISVSLGPLQDEWLTGRGQRLDAWLVPHSAAEAAGLSLLAAAWIARGVGVVPGVQQLLGLAGATLLAVLASQLLLPRDSLWQAFPVALLALVPHAGATGTGATGTHRLWLIAAGAVFGVILTAAHDGGAQWGPRFLLIATPAVIVLAAQSATSLAGAGPLRRLRWAFLAVAILAAILTSRAAYRDLRVAKSIYGRIVAATDSLTSRGGYVVTNAWWLDQVTAALYGTRTFLYAPDQRTASAILNELSRARQPRVALVWTGEPGGLPIDTAGSCFEITEVRKVTDRDLSFARTRCDAGR